MLTLLDVAKFNDGASRPLVMEAAVAAPEILLFPTETMRGISYHTQVITALPDGDSFRKANDGVDASKETSELRLVEAFIMNRRWAIDKASADAAEGGWGKFMAQKAKLHLAKAWQALGSQIYYGTSASANGFQGFVSSVNSAMVVPASSSTAATCSSVWGVKFGDTDVRLVLGLDGKIEISDPYEGEEAGANGKMMPAIKQYLLARPGLAIGSTYSIGRIKNIPTGATGLTDDLLDNLLECFKVGSSPDAIFMTKRSMRQLKDSRTATNPTGAPAPWPASIVGPDGKVIPLVVTESITNTETGA
jgi:hypothetical protein